NESRLPRIPLTDAMFRMRAPAADLRSSGTIASVTRTMPLRLTSCTCMKLSIVKSLYGVMSRMAALLTRMSSRPFRSPICLASAATDRLSVISTCAYIAPSSDAAVARPAASSTSATQTCAPSCAKRRAMLSPMPRPLPVTSATLSFRRCAKVTSLLSFARAAAPGGAACSDHASASAEAADARLIVEQAHQLRPHAQRNRVAGAQFDVFVQSRTDRSRKLGRAVGLLDHVESRDAQIDIAFGAKLFDDFDFALQGTAIRGNGGETLRPQPDQDRRAAGRYPCQHVARQRQVDTAEIDAVRDQPAAQEIHRRAADESCD